MPDRMSLLGLVLGIFCLSAFAHAATQRPLGLAELTSKADTIAIGTVTGRVAIWNPQHTQILTRTTFRISEVLKGSPGKEVVVETLGGVLDGVGMMAAGAPQFRPAEKDLIFLVRDQRTGIHRILGWEQGRFRVVADPIIGRERVTRNMGTVLPSSGFSGASNSASLLFLDDLKAEILRLCGRY